MMNNTGSTIDRGAIERAIGELNGRPGDNAVQERDALSRQFAEMRFFEKPLFAIASADDPLFASFKQASVIGAHFTLPCEWLPGAQSVISFFFPFTDRIKKANRADPLWPAAEWLLGRFEGQSCINEFCVSVRSMLHDAGYHCVIPSLDERFFARTSRAAQVERNDPPPFTSNWSERHAAFVCGLGTFGLSRGIITRRGMAGRLGSVITDLAIEPDTRTYSGIYEYCSNCGACVKRCPVGAITREHGKAHVPCSDFLDRTREKYNPKYGCGKCQTGVPCESGIPVKKHP